MKCISINKSFFHILSEAIFIARKGRWWNLNFSRRLAYGVVDAVLVFHRDVLGSSLHGTKTFYINKIKIKQRNAAVLLLHA